MKIEIIGKKSYIIGEKIENVINKKVNKLDKYFSDDTVLKVLLKKEGVNSCLELSIDGLNMRAQVVGENMYDLIDIAVPKLERQIRKHKTRLEKKLKTSAFEPAVEEVQEIPFSTSVVKEKVFNLKPMRTDEAVYMLDMLGHEFYVFLQEENNEIQVLYRRIDGDYGLIKPVIKK